MSILTMQAENALEHYSKITEEHLRNELNQALLPAALRAAMAYSLFPGGKRLRPALLLAACELLSGSYKKALPAAAAVEMIHTYSLIHDDLPALDNDSLRRGRPSAHVALGEAQAILAGDALLSLAFELLTREGAGTRVFAVFASRASKAAFELAKAAGASGMVAGQWQDIQSEGKKVSPGELSYIHTHKTGDLITGSLRAGALLGGAGKKALEAITAYGEQLGLLFQITDDILDAVSTPEELGKNPGKDETAGKNTYVTLYGLPAARECAAQTAEKAKKALKCLPKAVFFGSLIDFIESRNR